MSRPEVLIVAPTAGGHHGEYLRRMVDGLRQRGVARLAVAAHPNLLASEADTLASVATMALDVSALDAAGSLWQTGRATGALIRAATEAVRPHRVLVPYLDHAQLALALGLRFPFKVSIAGILFRATLHEPAVGAADQIRQLRKTAVLRLAARNPHLGPVLTLDPEAIAPLRALGLDARWLPDPVEAPAPTQTPDKVRAALGIEPGRRLAVLFGSLEERKGVFETLDAVRMLDADVAARLALVILGRGYPETRERLQSAVDRARQTAATVVFEERFVPDAELDDLVTAADVMLAPYRGHVGSSGVVLRAAAAGTPVLATSDGMVGREVRQHRLGQAVEPSAPSIAEALARAVRDPEADFDAAAAAAYAAAHGVDRFVDALADALS